MPTREEIQELLIVHLIAYNEELSLKDATEFWGKWKAELVRQPEHYGDCTQEPQTCNRCLVESLYDYADNAMKSLHSVGCVL